MILVEGHSTKVDKNVFLLINVDNNSSTSRFSIDKPSRLFLAASFYSW
jgi:hypothetical protein